MFVFIYISSRVENSYINLCEHSISRKVVGENVHVTIPKGNMGYDQYSVPDTVAVEPTFVAFF